MCTGTERYLTFLAGIRRLHLLIGHLGHRPRAVAPAPAATIALAAALQGGRGGPHAGHVWTLVLFGMHASIFMSRRVVFCSCFVHVISRLLDMVLR